MKKCLIVGNGGREASMALKLANSYSIYAYMSFKNPTIMRAIEDTKGDYFIGDILDGKSIAEYAEKVGVDIAVVNNDNSLAAGVVDCLKKKNILTFGPTRKGARIEWDKSFTRDLTKRINEKLNPFYIVVDDIQYLDTSINEFKERNLEIVVKPVGLTGGKGVKVMGKHLSDYVQAYEYARKNLISDGKVLLEEKINGYEFTIMGISDGNNIVISPVTYDYPFRYNDDIGPGTGGMGCFTLETKKLPFLSDDIIN